MLEIFQKFFLLLYKVQKCLMPFLVYFFISLFPILNLFYLQFLWFDFLVLYFVNLSFVLDLKLFVILIFRWVLLEFYISFLLMRLCFIKMTLWKAMIVIIWVYWKFCLSFWLSRRWFVPMRVNCLQWRFPECLCGKKRTFIVKLMLVYKETFRFVFYFLLEQSF